MDDGLHMLLPFGMVLGRVTAFVAVLPVLSFAAIPAVVRVGMSLALTVFLLLHVPVSAGAETHWLLAVGMMLREVLVGLSLGLMARLAFSAVQQAGAIAGQQMGLTMAQIIDPTTGEESEPIGTFFDIGFMLLFLIAGGHHLLLGLVMRSYQVLPAGGEVEIAAMVDGVVGAGSAMLLFALKLSAPMLAAFLMLGVLLAVLARVLPEMDILMTSLPLRVGLGFFMSAAMLPLIHGFVSELGQWINTMLA